MITIHADGTFVYALDMTDSDTAALMTSPANAADVFSYTVSDGHGGFDTAHLTIDVFYWNPGWIDPPPDGGIPGAL